jgi:hypothetical protein
MSMTKLNINKENVEKVPLLSDLLIGSEVHRVKLPGFIQIRVE